MTIYNILLLKASEIYLDSPHTVMAAKDLGIRKKYESEPLSYYEMDKVLELLSRMNRLDVDTAMVVHDKSLLTKEEIDDTLILAKSVLLKNSFRYVLAHFTEIKDMRYLIEGGFIPFITGQMTNVKRNSVRNIFEMWWQGYDPREIEFWMGKGSLEKLKHHLWIYSTKNYIVEEALAKADSFGLMFLYPDLMYKKSKRPITDMSIFRTKDSIEINHRTKSIVEGSETYKTIPVTRYSTGMSRSLFYNEDKETKFCGTFYYYEPESTTYLMYKNQFTAKNKFEAAHALLKQVDINTIDDENLLKKLKPLIEGRDKLKDLPYFKGEYRDDLMYTPKEARNIAETKLSKSDYDDSMPQNPYYIGIILGLYSMEDRYDQIICRLAGMLGYDIVILTHMIGSHQVVTEVLDVRDRAISFDSLVYVKVQ